MFPSAVHGLPGSSRPCLQCCVLGLSFYSCISLVVGDAGHLMCLLALEEHLLLILEPLCPLFKTVGLQMWCVGLQGPGGPFRGPWRLSCSRSVQGFARAEVAPPFTPCWSGSQNGSAVTPYRRVGVSSFLSPAVRVEPGACARHVSTQPLHYTFDCGF